MGESEEQEEHMETDEVDWKTNYILNELETMRNEVPLHEKKRSAKMSFLEEISRNVEENGVTRIAGGYFEMLKNWGLINDMKQEWAKKQKKKKKEKQNEEEEELDWWEDDSDIPEQEKT